MSTNTRIAETFTLPSKGMIYEESVNPDIVLGCMKTKHEMMRLSATDSNNKIMADIIDDCIDGDIGISSYDMCLGDYQYLLFKLRTITFGPEYDMGGTCPYCMGENYVTVNLDELEVNGYDDSIADLLQVKLPVTNSVVTLTLQTPRMLDRIKRLTKDRMRRVKNNTENPMLLYTITTSIEDVDGEVMSPIALEEWVKDLPMGDTNTLLNKINELNSKIGLQTDIEDVCINCGRYYKIPFQVTGEFFRPSN